MDTKFNIVPYVSVGEIKFGMTLDELTEIFGKAPDTNYKDAILKITHLEWDNVSIRLNKQGKVNEVTFLEGVNKAYYEGIDILNTPALIKILNKIEKPYNTVGFKIYLKIGIALSGFSRYKEEKTVSVFSKKMIDPQKSLDVSYKVYLLTKAGDKIERTFMVEQTASNPDGVKHLLCESDKKTNSHITYPYAWKTDDIPLNDLKKAVGLVLDGEMKQGASSNFGGK